MDVNERRHSASAKVPRTILCESLGLGPEARAVRIAAFIAARPDASQTVRGAADPGVGWLLANDGAQLKAADLAALTGYGRRVVGAAVKALLKVGALVLSDAGALGVVGWWPKAAQYSTTAVQRWRAAQKAATA